jgi:short-subunit dehydrogenase
MQLNYATLINTFVPLVNQLRQQPGESVIAHINSLASWIEIPKGSHYSAAKNAARSFFDSARIELSATNIKLLSIYPGFIQTDNKKEKMMMGISLEKAVGHIIKAIKTEKRNYGFPLGLKLLFRFFASLPWIIRSRIMTRLAEKESKKYTE